MHTCSKIYTDFPFAHRQHLHQGHCSQIHGHNWSFKFTFGSKERDENGFVVDFGDLKWIKAWLTDMFDHTLVLNHDDPWLDHFKFHLVDATDSVNQKNVEFGNLARIKVVPNAGAEGLAQFIYEEVERQLIARYDERVFIVSVEVFEDSKNSAEFKPTSICSHV